MRQRSFVIVAIVVAALVIGAVAVYAYDSSRKDVIASGTTIAGVDVGGMHAAEARKQVHAALAKQLDHPVVARHDDRSFRLSPDQLGITVDVDGMVHEALVRSRDGSIVSRTLRAVGVDSGDVSIPAQITYSQRAVDRFVRQVGKAVDRKAKDASLSFTPQSPEPVAGHDGTTVETGALRRAIVARLDAQDTSGGPIVVRTRVTKPKVTTANLAQAYPTVLIVDRSSFQLRLFKKLKLEKTYSIAVGQQGLETPAGLYHIQNKAVNPAWTVPNSAWAGSMAGQVVPGGTPENPLKARWLGIYAGAGIHGTDDDASIGSAASHGCVRMHIPDVIDLYDRVPVGAPIYIV